MFVVETIAKIRRAFFVQQKPIKQICRELKVSVRSCGRSSAPRRPLPLHPHQSARAQTRAMAGGTRRDASGQRRQGSPRAA